MLENPRPDAVDLTAGGLEALVRVLRSDPGRAAMLRGRSSAAELCGASGGLRVGTWEGKGAKEMPPQCPPGAKGSS